MQFFSPLRESGGPTTIGSSTESVGPCGKDRVISSIGLEINRKLSCCASAIEVIPLPTPNAISSAHNSLGSLKGHLIQ